MSLPVLVIRVTPVRRNIWKETMQKLLPMLKVVLWDEDTFVPESVEYAIVWDPPMGFFKDLVNLQCVISAGAGVSHVLKDPGYPKHVPLIRTVGEDLRRRMSEYVALHVLRFHKRLPEIELARRNKQWAQFVAPVAQEINVGIMGLGNMGAYAAKILLTLGYKVSGWTRRPKYMDGATVYSGIDQLPLFLSETNILVCMLPQTALTENILNRAAFHLLPDGAYLINVGRGEHVVDDDLLYALESGKLSGATLDVFRQEPLPLEHPFWSHPKVLLTCHTASSIEPDIASAVMANNILAFMRHEVIADIADIVQGY